MNTIPTDSTVFPCMFPTTRVYVKLRHSGSPDLSLSALVILLQIWTAIMSSKLCLSYFFDGSISPWAQASGTLSGKHMTYACTFKRYHVDDNVTQPTCEWCRLCQACHNMPCSGSRVVHTGWDLSCVTFPRPSLLGSFMGGTIQVLLASRRLPISSYIFIPSLRCTYSYHGPCQQRRAQDFCCLHNMIDSNIL